ncbi:MAG: hypothetical protein WC445_00725 [Patescibacteria group bacterium]
MDIKDKIEKIGGLEEAIPEHEISAIPEKKVEGEKAPRPEWEKVAPVEEKNGKKPLVAAVVHPVTEKPAKSETLVKIEKILEEDLESFYFSMPPEKQAVFKEKGEETASKIEKMVEAGKVVARKILKLIRAWLKIIPGVNKFFLEQEAKIKTDKVVVMSEKKME